MMTFLLVMVGIFAGLPIGGAVVAYLILASIQRGIGRAFGW